MDSLERRSPGNLTWEQVLLFLHDVFHFSFTPRTTPVVIPNQNLKNVACESGFVTKT